MTSRLDAMSYWFGTLGGVATLKCFFAQPTYMVINSQVNYSRGIWLANQGLGYWGIRFYKGYRGVSHCGLNSGHGHLTHSD